MAERGTVLACYHDAAAGKATLRELRRRGHWRSASVSQHEGHRVAVDNAPIPWVLAGALGGAFGLAAGWLLDLLMRQLGVPGWMRGVPAAPAVLGAIGALLGFLLARSLDRGLRRDLVGRYGRVVARDETIVIAQVRPRHMDGVLEVMRSASGEPPLTFAFLPARARLLHAQVRRFRLPPLPLDALRQAAIRLARTMQSAARHSVRAQSLPRHLKRTHGRLKAIQAELAEAARLGRSASMSAEWLLDNAYIIKGHIDEFQHNLPKRFYDELPVIAEGPWAGLPRVYGIASELVSATEARLDRDRVHEFVGSYQDVTPLTMGELWALPLMLRLRLIETVEELAEEVERRERERELADFWANRLLTAARADPGRSAQFLTEMGRALPAPSPHLADQLMDYLFDEEAALVPVRVWLSDALGMPLEWAIQQERVNQAADQVALANAIGSLRLLASLDWQDSFEALSRTEAVLREDPASVYKAMDFATRDRYRHAIEEMARSCGAPEADVASAAVAMAAAGPAALRHVGHYLLGSEREALEARLACRPRRAERARRWARRHAALVYMGSIGLGTAVVLAAALAAVQHLGAGPMGLALVAVVGLVPASELAVQATNYAVTRLMPPHFMPKLALDTGIPNECRTLVVIPMMLLTPESIRDEVEHLRTRYLANPEPNLLYALLSDYSDAAHKDMPEDLERLDIAAQGIRELSATYGPGRFFLFHRERQWSEGEQRWIGWERKRGKLEHLNRYLLGDPEMAGMLHVGDPSDIAGVRFVITLDSDTQLPRDTARRLVGTLAHPLNRPQLSPDRRRVVRGYTIIQPRVTTSLPSATATRFSRLYADTEGLDPYTREVSDVYMDLSGEGSYHGKGIYDLEAFSAVLDERFPENRLLSHDLLEGAHVRVGLASDIELLDLFPTDYRSHSRRSHRWTRGDWQIADWLGTTVPTHTGGREPNTLSAMGRWKIADNLRRSLLPPALVALLIVGWSVANAAPATTALVLLVLLLPPVLSLITQFVGPGARCPVPWEEIRRSAVRAIVETAVLPHQASISVDAIARVAWRRLKTRRLLLEWQTAQQAQGDARANARALIRQMAWIPLSALAGGAAVALHNPGAAGHAAPFLALWAVSPAVPAWLSAAVSGRRERPLTRDERRALRLLARETWRFFVDFVGPETNWLPPDNYQAYLAVQVAERTSPTNIGLGVLANFVAHDFGYITGEEALNRTLATVETLGRLERFEGHLLNWYDTRTMQPLRPRYVSMVDSGNLLGSLWAVDRCIEDVVAGPIVTRAALQGVRDALQLALRQQEPGRGPVSMVPEAVDLMLVTRVPHSASLSDLVQALRAASGPAAGLGAAEASEPEAEAETAGGPVPYWAREVARQVSSWNSAVDRFLPWVEVLAEPPAGGLLALGSEVHEWRRQALAGVPSVRDLASGDVPGLSSLVALARQMRPAELPQPVREWLDRLDAAAARAQQQACRLVETAQLASQGVQEVADGMDMQFLYDHERRLFYTGYNVSERSMDVGHYDLLASEARLGSFVAIARGEAPAEHWWALGRPLGTCAGERALLSWNGSMFEYLMPLLLTRNFERSLLDKGCRDAVACQIAYGRARSIPWGISEAAYNALDSSQVYQYRAFGVPGLGLKRGLEEDLVVAPYASALALMVNAPAAAANLRHLSALTHHRMRGEYGFYESLDYTRQDTPMGRRGIVVRTFMAHHQGMLLGALDNALHDCILQDRFHRDPRVKATESLLYERIPLTTATVAGPEREVSVPKLAPVAVPSAFGHIGTPDTPTPMTNLLSNGAFSVMVTNAGGGWIRRGDVEIGRWRADTTRDALGVFCYLKDVDSGKVWSTAHQPVQAAPERYGVTFAVDKAEFRRRDAGIETVTEVVVSPEDDVEVRLITLVNRSPHRRRIELTSYIELALAPHNADRAHPAFSKMFVETEALPEHQALLARRRPRSADEAPVWAMHVIAVGAGFDTAMRFETDRAQFLGRGRTPAAPEAMDGDLGGGVGTVMDPIFSLRTSIELQPDQRAQVAFVTGAADSRDEAVALATKYRDLQAVQRAQTMAWTHAQLELRQLRIGQEEAQLFQQLAAYVQYPSARLRPAPTQLARNLLGQSRLWPYGISGDLPIVVVTIGDVVDIEVVREALLAHSYWRARGLKADLIILNEEPTTYDQPTQRDLRRLIDAFSAGAPEAPGGVFLRSADSIPDDDRALLLSSARVVLVAARGGLSQQLAVPRPSVLLPPPLAIGKTGPAEPSAPLPFMELPYFNGLGGFTHDGKEYAIYLGPGTQTPHPWVNVIANPSFGTIVSESGSGCTWAGNSQANRLTPWSNDPVSDPPGEAIFIRDDDTGIFWTPTALPIRETDAYRARHGQGYTVFEHNSHAIEQEMTVFVPMDQDGGAPVRIQRLRLRNASSKQRRLTVTFACQLVLGTDREETQLHVSTQWDAPHEVLLARNPYHADYGSRVAFVSTNLPVVSFTGDRTELLGRNGSPARPAALLRTRLSGRVGAGLDAGAAVQVSVDLDIGATAEVLFVLGQGRDADEARALARQFRDPGAVDAALQRTRDWWDQLLETVQVTTPDAAADILLNRWLLYQDLSCRLWGRSAFYQSGGAYGFRDQLQDVTALVYAAPELTRAQILRAAAHQFEEGDVQHWWHEPSGAGVRTRISDDLLWLPHVTAHYVRVTGDTAVLDEPAPFLRGRMLEAGEHEAYFVPQVTESQAPLLEHCRRAIERGLTAGPRGLPLIGGGDWNDGLNRVGIGGKGESVWLAWFLVHVLNDFADLLSLKGRDADADDCRSRAEGLATTVEEQAWDGAWYRRAYFDDGTPMGSAESAEAQIDSIPQSWSVLSGAADPARSESAMRAVDDRLVRRDHRMVLLFTPPFDQTDHDPGYIKGYPPGVRENGGQYTHGGLWAAAAFARLGDGGKAVELLRMLGPSTHARTPEEAGRYRVEPYVVAADIYAAPGRVGQGGWTWYTGSAGLLYRVWVEEVLGLTLRGDRMTLKPRIPPEWPGFTLRYRYRGAVYEVVVESAQGADGGVCRVEVDGAPVPDGWVRLADDGGHHVVRVVMGSDC